MSKSLFNRTAATLSGDLHTFQNEHLPHLPSQEPFIVPSLSNCKGSPLDITFCTFRESATQYSYSIHSNSFISFSPSICTALLFATIALASGFRKTPSIKTPHLVAPILPSVLSGLFLASKMVASLYMRS